MCWDHSLWNGRGRGPGVDHRLHTLKPTDSIPWSVYLYNPISVFSQPPPTEHLAGVTDSSLSIHLAVHFTLHQYPSIHPPSRDLAHLHHSLSATHHLHLVHAAFSILMPHWPWQALVKTIICSDTSRFYRGGLSPPPAEENNHPVTIFPKCSSSSFSFLVSPNLRPQSFNGRVKR